MFKRINFLLIFYYSLFSIWKRNSSSVKDAQKVEPSSDSGLVYSVHFLIKTLENGMDTFLFFAGYWINSNLDWDHWLWLVASLEEGLTVDKTTE